MAGASQLRKRSYLTLLRKVEIINYFDSISHTKDAKSKTMEKFKIHSRSSLNTILNKKDIILRTYNDGSITKNRKTLKCGKFGSIDEKVRDWIENMRAHNLELSQDDIICKANDLLTASGENIKFSSGWFQGFMSRYNLKHSKFYGEARSVDKTVVDDWKPHLTELIKSWDPADIYNADETGLFYQLRRDHGYAFGKDQNKNGAKQSIKRVTVLFICSMNGEKLPPLVIGKFAKPRCFKGMKDLPVSYHANKNSWMTKDIFTSFLLKWNRQLAVSKRMILLFIDNCSAHPNISLSNITLCYFPPKTTSVLQPLDQGIIENFKIIYKRHLMRSLIHQVETTGDGYTAPNILEALYLILKGWDQVKITTVVNCFRKSFFVAEAQLMECTIDETPPDDIIEMIREEKLLQVTENAPIEGITDDVPNCATIKNVNTLASQDSSDSDEEDNLPQTIITKNEVFISLSKIRKFFKIKIPTMLGHITELDMAIAEYCKSDFKTKSIANYFIKKD